MKNNLLLLLCLASFTTLFAQDENERKDITERKHELRLDAIELIAVGGLELNYEYVLSKYSGVGGFISADITDDDESFSKTFSIGGFYRQYFFNRKDFGARGLFAEGLLQYGVYSDNYFEVYNSATDSYLSNESEYGAFGAGFAIGQKWVSTNGFIFEISAGVLRNFVNNDENYSYTEFGFRGGILVGYRF